MRSASPPAGTTDRASIAEASPAGERSGRDAAPGSAQDGETPTVDQSREWPFRDTAPRQDPAASRLDPIWGSDPPDAVRWHMDMTTDQEASTSESSDASPDSETEELPARNGEAIAQPPHRPRPTATPAQRQHPLKRPRPMAGRAPRHSMDPVSTGPRHRRESRVPRRSPQFPTRTGRRGVPSSLLEPWAPAGLRGIPGRALESRGRAGRMWVRTGALQISARARLRGLRRARWSLGPEPDGDGFR